ncbi:MAG: transcription termination/antitermination protein NusG [Clostridiales Family XIII bacterium]|nr:transcription termination/antitermination protein NusG [Clostridiales Family XIII bacterium]
MTDERKSKTNMKGLPSAADSLPDEDFYDDSDETSARWYVIHTYSGHENKVKSSIEKLVENYGDEIIFRQTLPDGMERSYTMADLVLKIQVPVHDVAVLKDGQHKIKSRKMFPGYVLVKMIVTDKSWYLVRNTQGVTGFVGYTTATHKNRPVPLSKEEVRRMGIEKVNIELDINVGDSIKVINGPFESFTGVVEEVNPEKETLKARISMFGRDTPVELIYDQVDKVY